MNTILMLSLLAPAAPAPLPRPKPLPEVTAGEYYISAGQAGVHRRRLTLLPDGTLQSWCPWNSYCGYEEVAFENAETKYTGTWAWNAATRTVQLQWHCGDGEWHGCEAVLDRDLCGKEKLGEDTWHVGLERKQ